MSGAGVQLEIHCQRRSEDETFKTLTARDPPLTNGDKLQIHVRTARPQYLYVYWYDPAGQSRRLWPDSPESQRELSELDFPAGRNEWFTIEGSHGNEMVIAGASEKPLDAAALAALEQTPSFAAGNRIVTAPVLLPISGTERGLGAVVTAQESARQPLRRSAPRRLRHLSRDGRAARVRHTPPDSSTAAISTAASAAPGRLFGDRPLGY